MAKKKNDPRATPEARATDVLAGRRQLPASEVAALVREVNPTARSLDRPERDARYALKAQLQSFLLVHFEGEIRVTPAPELGEGMVLLNLSHGGQSAGHVPLLELDEEARRIARHKLDSPPDSDQPRIETRPAGPSATTPPQPPGSWLERGQRALDEYDFDEARRCFEAALDTGHPAAAEALLGLLVDTLGLDEEALDLASRLDSKARRPPAVRRRLGTAAARLGQLDLAAHEFEGLTEREDAPALALLARAWLAQGDTTKASSWIDATRRADPAEPALLALTEELRQHREGARRDEEQALQRLHESGAVEQATEAAKALLARFADSSLARRIVQEAEQRERLATLASLATEVDTLRRQGALQTAAEVARRAATLADPAERAAWLAQAQALEADAQDRHTQAEVERVMALRPRDDRTFLLALAALGPEARLRLRDATPDDPRVTWLLQALSSPASRREQAVDAVLALHSAHELLGSNPEGCCALLDHHAPALEDLPAASALRAAARQRLDLRAREMAMLALQRASEALAQGRPGEALTQLQSPGFDLLDPPDAERARALREQAQARELRQRHEASVHEHLGRDDLFGALRAIDRILEGPEPGEQWVSERARLELRLRELLRWRCTAAAGADEVQIPPLSSSSPIPVPLITPDGHRLVLPTSYGNWVFVRVISMTTGKVERRLQLRTPMPMGHIEVVAQAHEVVLSGDQGVVLRLSLPGWEPIDWWDSASLRRPGEKVEPIDCARDGRFVWLGLEQRGGSHDRGVIVDLHRRTVVRTFKKSRLVDALPGDTPRMALFSLERSVSLHDPRGASVPPQLAAEGRPLSLLSTPDGGYAMLCNALPDSEGSHLLLALLSASGELRASSRIDDVDSDRISQIGIADGRIFVRAMSFHEDEHCYLIEFDHTTLRELRRDKTHRGACMVSDLTGRYTALIDGWGGALQIRPLQAGVVPSPPTNKRPYDHGLFTMLYVAGPWQRDALGLERELRAMSPSAVEAWVEAARARKKDAPEFLDPLVEALAWAGFEAHSNRLLDQACALHPGHPTLELRLVERLMLQRRFAEAAEHLRQADPSLLPGGDPALSGASLTEDDLFTQQSRKQLALFEAVNALQTGDLARAHRALQAVLGAGDMLYPTLRGWLRATAPEAPQGPSPEGDHDDWLLALLDTVGQADQALDAGDPRAALRALSSRWTFVPREEQLLARHWQAWQQAAPAGDDEYFFATEAAAAFVEAMQVAENSIHPPLPRHTWSDDRLRLLREQATRWLDAPSPKGA